jgi:hypothetical protein
MGNRKQRRPVVLGLLLLVSSALVLLGQQWTSPTEPVLTHPAFATRQTVEPPPAKIEAPGIEAAAPNVKLPASSATPPDFRGRIIDVVTRRPVA